MKKKGKHPVREKYHYFDFESENKIPKVRFRKDWKKVKDWKWEYQVKEYWRDLCNGALVKSAYNTKEYRKVQKLVKHKLYFKLPFTAEDIERINKVMPIEDAIREQQINVERLKERESQKQLNQK